MLAAVKEQRRRALDSERAHFQRLQTEIQQAILEYRVPKYEAEKQQAYAYLQGALEALLCRRPVEDCSFSNAARWSGFFCGFQFYRFGSVHERARLESTLERAGVRPYYNGRRSGIEAHKNVAQYLVRARLRRAGLQE